MRHIIRILFLAMIGWFGGTAWVLQAHPAPLQGPPPQGGPATHKVYSATSKDGLNWTADNIVLLEKASVPCATVTNEGNIRIYYVDASTIPEGANCAESTDGGKTFKPLGLTIANRAETKAVDPCIVHLKDGRYRLYYLAAKQQIGETDVHEIHSAISTNGVAFTEEKGVFSYQGLVDPDVFKARKEWLMFVFSANDHKTVVATSRDGLNFKYVGPLSIQNFGTTAPVRLDDGRFRLYAFDQRSNRAFYSFLSTDGLNWTQESGTRLQLEGPGQITDPFVIRLRDGSWKMYYKYGPEGGNPPPPTGSDSNFYMSFHACNPASANCGDPRNHQVYLAQSTDGTKWNLVPNWKPFAGSVPDVIRRGNTLYVFSVGNGGRLARYHLDTKIQDEPVPFNVSGLDNLGFVDPSLTMDENGKLVLFFLRGLGPNGSDPAGCGSQSSCEKFFGSATEVDGSDGTQFTLDSGSRALVTLGGSSPYRSASDPDIFFDGKQYVLYISHGPSISVWTSAQLRGSYQKTLDLSNGTGGIPSGHFDSQSGKYWTFSHITQNGAAVIRRAVHSDFSKSLVETDWSTVLTAPMVNLPAGVNVESPGFAVNTSGSNTPPPASDNDVTFFADAGIRVDNASNPAPGVDVSGATYLYYQDRQTNRELVSVSSDGLAFPAGSVAQTFANDPRRTRLPNGSWRRYQFNLMTREMLSESSSDGLRFTPDAGVRYKPQPQDNNTLGVYDLFADSSGGVVMLYLGDLMGKNNCRRAYSTDNGLTFTFDRNDVLGDGAAGGGANSFVDQKSILLPDGRRRLFVMRQGIVYSFISTDEGKTFSQEAGVRLSPKDFPNLTLLSLHDPVAVRLADGRYRIYVAAMASQNRSVIVSATTK